MLNTPAIKKMIKILRNVRMRDETPKELRIKIRRIANELGMGEEQMIKKNIFLTYCPNCKKKNVLRIYLDESIEAIAYECKTGCDIEDIKKTVIKELPYARPWISGFF